jgi:hypothetical protein
MWFFIWGKTKDLGYLLVYYVFVFVFLEESILEGRMLLSFVLIQKNSRRIGICDKKSRKTPSLRGFFQTRARQKPVGKYYFFGGHFPLAGLVSVNVVFIPNRK